jgi:class 3 adenylate cyclase
LYLDPGHTALQARGVRAGIHIGSVDVIGEDIFGTEVDVAARVVGGIEGAEIWLSDQAKRDLERAGARRHTIPMRMSISGKPRLRPMRSGSSARNDAKPAS